MHRANCLTRPHFCSVWPPYSSTAPVGLGVTMDRAVWCRINTPHLTSATRVIKRWLTISHSSVYWVGTQRLILQYVQLIFSIVHVFNSLGNRSQGLKQMFPTLKSRLLTSVVPVFRALFCFHTANHHNWLFRKTSGNFMSMGLFISGVSLNFFGSVTSKLAFSIVKQAHFEKWPVCRGGSWVDGFISV